MEGKTDLIIFDLQEHWLSHGLEVLRASNHVHPQSDKWEA